MEEEIRYKDDVRIKSGIYKGMRGKVVGENIGVFGTTYLIRIDTGDVPSSHWLRKNQFERISFRFDRPEKE